PGQLEYKTGGPGKLENLYTRELLEAAFADFASLEVREYDARIDEGSGHDGLSALVDLVGSSRSSSGGYGRVRLSCPAKVGHPAVRSPAIYRPACVCLFAPL